MLDANNARKRGRPLGSKDKKPRSRIVRLPDGSPKKTVKIAAAIMGISERAVYRAVERMRTNPEAHEAAKAGLPCKRTAVSPDSKWQQRERLVMRAVAGLSDDDRIALVSTVLTVEDAEIMIVAYRIEEQGGQEHVDKGGDDD